MNTPKSIKNTRTEKKAVVLAAPLRKKYRLPIMAAVILVCALGGSFYITSQSSVPTKAEDVAVVSPLVDNGDTIRFSINSFDDHRARYYTYALGDTTIRYFILRSSDGVVRAAFDACDVCWRAGKGYQQAGDEMVCGNCGQRFESLLVNEVQGGCNPAPLARTVQGDQLIIRVHDIVQGRGYFNL